MLLDAIRDLLVDDPHGWDVTKDVEADLLHYHHPKARVTITMHRTHLNRVCINHRRLGPIGRWRLRRALDARVAKIIMDHLLDQVLIDSSSRKELT